MVSLLTDGRAAPQVDDPPNKPGMVAQLWQTRGVVATTFGLTVLAVAGLLLALPTSYVATGSVVVAEREPIIGGGSAAWTQKVGDPADMESNILLIRSPRLMRAVLAQPGIEAAVLEDCRAVARQVMARLRPIDCSRLADEGARFQWVQDRYAVAAMGRSRVISVSYRSPVPAVAQAMANGLVTAFLEDERTKILHPREDALQWVQSRIKALDAEMRGDEASIEDFRAAHGLVRGVNGSLTAERLTQASQQLSEAKAAEADAALRMQEASGGAGSRQALESRAVADVKQQLATARTALASASQRLGPRNPDLIAARRQEAALSGALATEVSRVTDAARRNLEAARARTVAAQRELETRSEAATKAGEAETQIAAMTRDLEIKRDSFVDLSKRASQLETERRMMEPTMQLVALAEMPIRPAFPQKLPFLLGGLTLASVLSVAAGMASYKPETGGPLALGRTYTRVPILSRIPQMRLDGAARRRMGGDVMSFPLAAAVALMDSHPPLLEAMRILYARLTLAGFGTTRKTLMVTSEVSGEGKTFATLALARLARAGGRRVLVIEASLRQPAMEDALGGPPTPGLSGFLAGGPVEVVQLAAVPGVDFVLAGEGLGTSTEMLSGPRIDELLGWARAYDLVLIDGAPVSTLMDSVLLARHVEGVLFCMRTGRAPAKNALSSLPEMQREHDNVVGMVLTFVPDENLQMPEPIALPSRQGPSRAMRTVDA